MTIYDTKYNINQPSFSSGEISPSVSMRVDLDKYEYALTKAKNLYVKPYGRVSRRSGTVYCGETKYHDKKSILHKFNKSPTESFLLEFGDLYIRVWFDGGYTGIELSSPWSENDLVNLRFAQSADVLFVCSGNNPIYTISRYSDSNWEIKKYEFYIHPFIDINSDKESNVQISYTGGGSTFTKYSTPGSYTFTAPISTTYTFSLVGSGGYGWSIAYGGNGGTYSFSRYMAQGTTATINVGSGGAWYTETITTEEYGDGKTRTIWTHTGHPGGGTSAVFGTEVFSAPSGTGGVRRNSVHPNISGHWYNVSNGINGGNGLGASGGNSVAGSSGGNGSINVSWNVSVITGNTISSTKDIFTNGMVGSQMKITHDVPTKEQTLIFESGETGVKVSEPLICGKSWSFSSRGNWSGTMYIQTSNDGNTWTTIHTFTSRMTNGIGDNNVTTSGVVEEEPIYVRIQSNIFGSNYCASTITSNAYSHIGVIEITSVNNSKNAIFNSIKSVYGSEATNLWNLGAWSYDFGFPKVITFFQDRLVLAANEKSKFTIWMSRTSDYVSFEEEIVDGSLTADSGIQVPLINRDFYEIRHLIAGQDLVAFTVGNEWIISGNEVVTPSNVNPRAQTGVGSSDVEPQFVNNKIVYIQRRSSAVRDYGYSYYSDSYAGEDLTILSKHLVEFNSITSSAFSQEPDSIIYFTRNDGAVLCLTYLPDQKIYAWSRIFTDGSFKFVESVYDDRNDIVFAIVERIINGEKRKYIEYFSKEVYSEKAIDHTMSDCSIRYDFLEATNEITGLSHLRGKDVQVQGDNYVFAEKDVFAVSDEGIITLPTKVKKVVVGLQYDMEFEQPRFHREDKLGSMQGRKRTISKSVLTLENSYGGYISTGFGKKFDPIIYDISDPFTEFDLFTGNKRATLPASIDEEGVVCIKHSSPYPFNLSSLVRVIGMSAP